MKLIIISSTHNSYLVNNKKKLKTWIIRTTTEAATPFSIIIKDKMKAYKIEEIPSVKLSNQTEKRHQPTKQ